MNCIRALSIDFVPHPDPDRPRTRATASPTITINAVYRKSQILYLFPGATSVILIPGRLTSLWEEKNLKWVHKGNRDQSRVPEEKH